MNWWRAMHNPIVGRRKGKEKRDLENAAPPAMHSGGWQHQTNHSAGICGNPSTISQWRLFTSVLLTLKVLFSFRSMKC
jgi:hypothetical protein